MGAHKGRRCLGIVLSAAAMFAASPGWAAAGPSKPPEDVVHYAQGPALAAVQAAVEGDPSAPDFSGSLHSPIPREVFLFSRAFLAGQSSSDAVTSASQWIAPVQRGSAVLGTVTIWKPHGEPEVALIDGDVELASALTGMSDDELFIRDDRTAGYFALLGDSVRPLNANARRELPSAAPMADLRTVVSARIRSQNAEAGGIRAPIGRGGGPVSATERTSLLANRWLDGAVLVIILGGMALTLARRARAETSV